MSVHINASGVNAGAQEGDIDIATMKKFVSYCRLKCAPRLSETAATMLSSQVRWVLSLGVDWWTGRPATICWVF